MLGNLAMLQEPGSEKPFALQEQGSAGHCGTTKREALFPAPFIFVSKLSIDKAQQCLIQQRKNSEPGSVSQSRPRRADMALGSSRRLIGTEANLAFLFEEPHCRIMPCHSSRDPVNVSDPSEIAHLAPGKGFVGSF